MAKSGVEPVGWPWILIDAISEPLTVNDLGFRDKVISPNLSTKNQHREDPSRSSEPIDARFRPEVDFHSIRSSFL